MPPLQDIPRLPGPRPAPVAPPDIRMTLAELHSPRPAERDRAVDAVRASPEHYPPPVLYALALALYQRGEPDAAVFWYHAGQLRARFDVERCADPTVAGVMTQLRRQYGEPINRYAFVEADLAVLRQAVQRAVDWDRRTARTYDHRWVNVHGARVFAEPGQQVPVSRPRAAWADIAERVRTDYLDGMRMVLDDLERWAPLDIAG